MASIGQSCFKCEAKGKTTFVKPFRMEVIKPRSTKTGGILGGGPRRARRVPTEPIGEKEVTNTGYTDSDRKRNSNAAGDALLNDSTRGFNKSENGSFKYEPRANGANAEAEICAKVDEQPKMGIPKKFVHKCEGCASGVCRSRYLPNSLIHDASDGNTVSTSASIMTNSSVDKADFIDRDQDFTGFEIDEEDWTEV